MCADMCGGRPISKLKFQSKMKKTGKPTTEHWTLIAKNLLCRSTVLATGRTQSLSSSISKSNVLVEESCWFGMERAITKLKKWKSYWRLLMWEKTRCNGKWSASCLRPTQSEQNPVEDVWLQTKNFIRKYWLLCKSFAVVKWLFKFFTSHQHFDFPKLEQYKKRLSLI